MKNWPSERIQNLLGIDLPLIQAPMAGADSPELALAVSEAGGLGSLACTLFSVEQLREIFHALTQKTSRPFNLNFFCHPSPPKNLEQERIWRDHLKVFYDELGLKQEKPPSTVIRKPFDESFCELLEELKPRVVSFHFGLPEQSLLRRLQAAKIKILASATSVAEALWLEQRGCDAVIAQGFEAGGHRGTFLNLKMETQVGSFALIPQVADAVKIPLIAAGGIADARGIVAALALGADAVQLGTAYLFCPEARISPLYREALKAARDEDTVLTNVFSGRPARGLLNRFIQMAGPLSELAPAFPLASAAVNPLRLQSEARGSKDFMQMWAGQAAALCRAKPAGELTLKLAGEALALASSLGCPPYLRST